MPVTHDRPFLSEDDVTESGDHLAAVEDEVVLTDDTVVQFGVADIPRASIRVPLGS